MCNFKGKYICESCFNKVPKGGLRNGNYSIFTYTGIVRKAIISLKYKFAFDIADELTEISLKNLKTFEQPKNIVLLPIPLHFRRENWRGFNQSEIIGEKLAKATGWKYVSDLLVRNKNTQPQVGLKGLARHQNLEDVFILNKNYEISKIINKKIIIFDDVYTTGSTIKEAKKVLINAGFKKVFSLTVAR
ncbi:MAG: ComF family protein [bacterium]|nr:MAG: ComF family protein [bacterium]